MTIAEGVEAFLAHKTPRIGERHLRGLKGHLVRFARAFGTDHVDEMASETIEAWIVGLPGLSAVTRNKHRTSLKAFYTFAAAKAQKWCEHSPLGDLTKERVVTKEPRAYSPADVAKIMQAAACMTIAAKCGGHPLRLAVLESWIEARKLNNSPKLSDIRAAVKYRLGRIDPDSPPEKLMVIEGHIEDKTITDHLEAMGLKWESRVSGKK